ncbi:hypothetical protein KAOT1_13377 [Kordia algicida OT-1]|uniref:Uncharacterized protein n=1 Tax=Kordia algicida OT-1 TaxID=391587 RepID=A9DJX8_9FLAO|nr:hypothetical protein KAOT1_13377 [Kordia algicida OT-1]
MYQFIFAAITEFLEHFAFVPLFTIYNAGVLKFFELKKALISQCF